MSPQPTIPTLRAMRLVPLLASVFAREVFGNGLWKNGPAGHFSTSSTPTSPRVLHKTSGSVNMSLAIEIPFQGRAGAASDRPTGVAGGATQGVTALAGPLTACGAFAAPDERRRVRV